MARAWKSSVHVVANNGDESSALKIEEIEQSATQISSIEAAKGMAPHNRALATPVDAHGAVSLWEAPCASRSDLGQDGSSIVSGGELAA
jgi:hypothetical protein